MKITDVKVETIRIPMKKPFRIAFAVQDHSLNVLVKISTDEGLWGIGEAAPFEPVTGESAATVLEALKLFRTGLIGMDPLDVEGIHRMMDRLLSGNTSAKAAVAVPNARKQHRAAITGFFIRIPPFRFDFAFCVLQYGAARPGQW